KSMAWGMPMPLLRNWPSNAGPGWSPPMRSSRTWGRRCPCIGCRGMRNRGTPPSPTRLRAENRGLLHPPFLLALCIGTQERGIPPFIQLACRQVQDCLSSIFLAGLEIQAVEFEEQDTDDKA